MTVQSKRKIFDGRYEILSIVGRGAASVVYHARHVTAPGSEVALKVLLNPKDGTSLRDSLRKEALAMVSARSRYVVRLDDFHSVGDLSYLSMEFAPESDLRKYVQKIGGKLGPEQAELFLLQSAEALSVTHQAGIIHRDIKPDNLLVLSDSEIRLADFGIAVLPGDTGNLEDLQRGVGTMNYLAPEVLEGTVYDRRSDIYALGVIFYEMVSGQHPFEKAPLAEQIEIRRDGTFPHLQSLAPSIPGYLVTAIMKAMSFDAANRFQSARELIQSLLASKDGTGTAENSVAAQAPVEPRPAEPRPIEPKSQATKPQIGNSAQTEDSAPSSAKVAIKPEYFAPTPRDARKKMEVSAPKDIIEEANEEAEENYQEKPSVKSSSNVVDIPPSRDKSRPAPATHSEDIISDSQSPADNSAPGRKKTALVDQQMIDRFRKAKEGVEKSKKPEKQAPDKPISKPEKSGQPESMSKKPKLVAAVAAILILFLMFGRISNFISGLIHSGSSSNKVLVNNDAGESADGDSSDSQSSATLNIASLPSGTYAGTINNLLPGAKSPIVFISSGKSVTVIIGIAGWLPVRLPAPIDDQQHAETKTQLRSNGIMLVISGQGDNGVLSGEFRNTLTGDKGTWNASVVGGNA